MTDAGESAQQTPRKIARDRKQQELLEVARRHLGEVGAAGLSLRAIARECGLVSSAIYRYFVSRDALLTVLIIEAYDALGLHVESAEAGVPRSELAARFTAAAHAMREWGQKNPHQYALIFGSPVPGYSAPQDTVASASRVGLVLFAVLRDAYQQGIRPAVTPSLTEAGPSVSQLRQDFGLDVPDTLVLMGVEAWSRLHGAIAFEIFGQFNKMVSAPGKLYSFIIAEELTRFGLGAGSK
ncbi:TetR/AcrR family transcriptional regulator [Leucobacter insecticola]|uniref:TetR/AcrR family transcriptional regulator n=1 Tax=Leucobacter insecticola TaxID=2714934 RepID=UPI00197DEC1D|nr:TetR/AcrR family transcriptional regulator [Leucobacter insecticola]